MEHRSGITKRQSQVVRHIARGRTNKEIAFQLGITEAGVKKHIEALMRHYRVARRTALVQRAIQQRDLELDDVDDGLRSQHRRSPGT